MNTRRMKWGDSQLLTDVNGVEYLEYSERQSKTRTEAELRNVKAVKPKAFSFANGSLRGSFFTFCDADVYLRKTVVPSFSLDVDHGRWKSSATGKLSITQYFLLTTEN